MSKSSKNTWSTLIKVAITVLTAIAGAFGLASCM